MLSLRLALVPTILVFAIACGGNSSSSPTSPAPTPGAPSSTVVIPVGAESLGNRAFTPGDVSITPGTTVTWMNTDTISHTSTSNAAGWNSGTLAPGRQFSFAFQTAGTFPYHCAIHPGMVGTVVVR